jgi:hypothetical protein
MLDDDDLWLPAFLETASSALAEHPGCGFAMTDHWLVDERGEVLERESDEAARRFGRAGLPSGVYHDVLARHLVTKTMTLVTSLFRREALEAVGFMPEGGHVAPEYALFLQLGARRVSVAYTAERLGAYRVHSGQSIPADRIAHGETVLSILRTLADAHSLDALEQQRLGEVFRSTTIELAINHARAGHRRTALCVLRGYRDFGGGMPDPRRLVVLGCFLAGAGPVALRTRTALRSLSQRRATTVA